MNNKLTIKAFNHIAIQISDVEKSRDFYSETLGLKEIPAPAFDYPVIWFSLENGRELHLIGRKPEAPFTPARSNHFALEVSDIYLAEKILKENEANCLPIKSRPDGILQLFLTDPDGNFIELCQI
jgi:catechol 2,3-dioxygenase-like lactoylglutathione lyase family enzyme